MRNAWKKEALADVLNLALGAWLFLSPWVLGFTAETPANWNAWLSGLLVGAVAIAALAAFAEWEEWISLLLGIWVAIAPWVVGFTGHAAAIGVHVIVGIAVAVIAAVRLWMLHHSPPRVTA
jgi:SPW repeat